jgi:hypothetical protein
LDEFISLHECANALRKLGLHGIFYYAWIIPAVILVGFFLASFFKFLMHLPQKTKWRFILSGGVFLLGAVGFELLGSGIEEQLGAEKILLDPLYQFLMTTEETLEMLGTGQCEVLNL